MTFKIVADARRDELAACSRKTCMIVCLCHNVSDRAIRELAARGHSLTEVVERTGAGTACGMCRLTLARVHAAAARPSPDSEPKSPREAA